ncbi:MAG TPA: hypothetical protein VGP25_12725 [Gemmatimonadaceae bacterium]|nr:hypothetical protein [Gemmatimonadaceae bacterium]
MKHPIYTVFGAVVIALVVVAEARGWTPMRPTEVKNVPRSIRDNPGAYRPHYRPFLGGGHYMGGK